VPAGRSALFGERISAGRKPGHVAATFRLALTKEWVAKPQGNYKHLGNKPVASDASPRLSATRFVSLKTKGANPCHA